MPFNAAFSWWIKKRMKNISHAVESPLLAQKKVFDFLVSQGGKTSFGSSYSFNKINNFKAFSSNVPLHSYEDLYPYIEQIIKGEHDVLWPGKIKWFSKSSGTTNAKSKIIPVSKEAIFDCHYKGGKDLLSIYHHRNKGAKLFGGKHLILGGSSELNKLGEDSYIGDLSAIIIRNLPFWTEIRRTPKRKIALMSNWDKKIDLMSTSVLKEDIRIIAGVPSWMLVLLQEVLEKSEGKTIKHLWPKLQMYMHGGVNFEPYQNQFKELLRGLDINYYQTYNASEGFFGLQYNNEDDDMILLTDHGIYYEFIPMDQFDGTNSKTIELKDVEIDKNYALVISTNAGLWRYIIGDTVKFTSTQPYKIKVTGRTKHFINAFGEELIIENTDQAITKASNQTGAKMIDYTVAPIYIEGQSRGGHEWLIEFEKAPNELDEFTKILDETLKKLNSDYEAKRFNDMILEPPKIKVLAQGTFHQWLSTKDKMGGQNKIPRLSNNRTFVEELKKLN